MVQLEPNLHLMLKHLAGSGAVLTAESTVRSFGCAACSPPIPASDLSAFCLLQAALDHSLPIKRREAGLQTLVLWGRLLARNGRVGASYLCLVQDRSRVVPIQACMQLSLHACWLLQDYLIAEGYNSATARGDTVAYQSKYYFSQDGVRSGTHAQLLWHQSNSSGACACMHKQLFKCSAVAAQTDTRWKGQACMHCPQWVEQQFLSCSPCVTLWLFVLAGGAICRRWMQIQRPMQQSCARS